MKVTRMAAPLGAIVSDLDLKTVSADQWAELNALFCQHHVLVFPGQSLTPDAQVDFAGLWGPLIPFPYGGLPDYPNIIELKNQGKAKDVNQHWHSDMTYVEIPPPASVIEPEFKLSFDTFTLFESVRTKSGLRYEIREEWALSRLY